MAEGADWFARKAGNTAPAVRRPLGIQVPAQAPAPVVQQPQGGVSVQEEDVGTEDLSLTDMLAGRGTSRGAQATKTETMNCPSCGSRNFFSNRNGGMLVKPETGEQVAANPKCFECGYNGRFTQGDEASWA